MYPTLASVRVNVNCHWALTWFAKWYLIDSIWIWNANYSGAKHTWLCEVIWDNQTRIFSSELDPLWLLMWKSTSVTKAKLGKYWYQYQHRVFPYIGNKTNVKCQEQNGFYTSLNAGINFYVVSSYTKLRTRNSHINVSKLETGLNFHTIRTNRWRTKQ